MLTATKNTNLPENNLNPHMKLSAFLQKVGIVLHSNFTAAYWIQVEVSKFTNVGQHAYFDFVEYDEHGNEVAKARGNLWASNKSTVLSKFVKATGSQIQSNMKLLLKLKVQFKPQYGLSFVVDDIDPSYTLGDMQAKLKAIREALIKANLYDKNKKLLAPSEFTRIAVISPDGAAGLADFMREADAVQSHRLCQFTYYSATFQGKDAGFSILNALNEAVNSHRQTPFNAVVIIRGGGAASDLAWLNDYDLAAALCNAPLPVFTGIGHQVDDTILDEVSFMRFDTPSKVSAYIAGSIIGNANEAINDMMSIIKASRHAITLSESRIDALMSGIQSQGMQTISKFESELSSFIGKIRTVSEVELVLTEQKINAMMDKIRVGYENEITITEQNLRSMMAEVIGLSPKKTLERGYALIRDMNGSVLTSRNVISNQASVVIEMRDGRVTINNREK